MVYGVTDRRDAALEEILQGTKPCVRNMQGDWGPGTEPETKRKQDRGGKRMQPVQ